MSGYKKILTVTCIILIGIVMVLFFFGVVLLLKQKSLKLRNIFPETEDLCKSMWQDYKIDDDGWEYF